MTTNILYRTSSTEANPVTTSIKGTPLTNLEVDANFKSIADNKAEKDGVGSTGTWPIGITGNAGTVTNGVYTTNKDATGGVAGLTLFKLNLKNSANTFTNFITNTTTAARTWTMPDKDGIVALASDITGTNSGTNTGDETLTTIKSKLGITTLSGSNTGDQTLGGLGAQAALVSGSNIKTVGGVSLLGSGDVPLGGTQTVVIVSTTSQTAVVGRHYVLTNVAATTVTLPAGVSGDMISVTTTGTLLTNVIAPNGAETIMEVAGSMTLDEASVTVTLRYLNSSWRII